MTENPTQVVPTRHVPANLPMNNGVMYKVLAGILAVGLAIIFGLGFVVTDGIGIFENDGSAWTVVGLSILFMAASLFVLLFTLGTTVFRVRSHLNEAITLHEIIENNYAKLQAGTDDLRNDLKELRALLAEARTLLAKANEDARARHRKARGG